MSDGNLYQAPAADLSDAESAEYGELAVFSARGRIGRMRYIAWTAALYLVVFGVGIVLGLIVRVLELQATPFSAVSQGLISVVSVIIGILWTIQRCHDFNANGWLAILGLIPLVNLVFWFIPGNVGTNRYGAPPPENTIAVKILFWLFITGSVLLLLIVIGSALFSGMSWFGMSDGGSLGFGD